MFWVGSVFFVLGFLLGELQSFSIKRARMDAYNECSLLVATSQSLVAAENKILQKKGELL